MEEPEELPEPAEGIEIKFSRLKLIAFTGITAFGGLAGLGLVCAKLSGGDMSWVTWKGFILGLALAICLIPTCVMYIRRVLASSRLIIADDRFQIVEMNFGNERVVLEVPFENIDKIRFERRNRAAQLGIDLIDTSDPYTYARWRTFYLSKKLHYWHLCYKNVFEIDLPSVSKKLKKAFNEWTGKEED